MKLSIDVGLIVAFWLVALRVGAVFAMSPLFGFASVPANIRVLYVFGLSAVLMGAFSVNAVALSGSIGGIATAALSELVVGGLFAFGVYAAFAAFQLAGRIMDMQLGFGVASLIDPTTRTSAPLLGTGLHLLALTVFFAVDGHHMIIRGIAFSLERIPPGTAMTDIDSAAVIAQFGGMFVYALAIAAPVMFVLLMVDVALAIVARTMPQMNVFIVSLPLKIMVGLATLLVSMQYLNPVMLRVFENLFDYWHRILA
jgi:flagellar biosynthesis protein FliR